MKYTLIKLIIGPESAVSAEDTHSEHVDRLGAVASSLCAVHCVVCALLPAVFGALGLGFMLGHEAEWMFTLLAVIFAGIALLHGWRRHGSVHVAGMLAVGIVGLLVSRGIEMNQTHDEHSHHSHHEVVAFDARSEHGEHDEHQRDHHEGPEAHHETSHLAGASVGALAGLFLLFGHLLNIRTSRRCRKDCCT